MTINISAAESKARLISLNIVTDIVTDIQSTETKASKYSLTLQQEGQGVSRDNDVKGKAETPNPLIVSFNTSHSPISNKFKRRICTQLIPRLTSWPLVTPQL